LALLVALLLLVTGMRRLSALVLLLGLIWLYTASTTAFGTWMMESLEQPFPPVAASDRPQADVIVLLGGGVHARKSSQVLGDLNLWSDRLLYTAALYQEGKAPVIILTGGGNEGVPSEAELTRDILKVMGVPEQAMILEGRARDTYDNAVYTTPILKARQFERVLLVTSAFHMRRSVALFAAQGVDVIPAATDHQITIMPTEALDYLPTMVGLTYTHYAMHEMVGYVAYQLLGRL
jgi:uncharacterized SAM-binding protein YcdF (DUF218 family)